MNRKAASGFLFVALASFALSAVALQQPPLAQGWHHTQMSDPYRGAFTRFSLTGKFLKTPPADASNRPSLAVDCSAYNRSHKSKFVRGTLVVGDPLKIDWVEPEQIETMSYFPEVSVRYRLDDAKEDQENWTPSANKKSASFSKASLEKMLRAHTIEITTHDNDGPRSSCSLTCLIPRSLNKAATLMNIRSEKFRKRSIPTVLTDRGTR